MTPPYPVRKRSLQVAGHSTSISLEDPFWEALQDMAIHQQCSLAELVSLIDQKRLGLNLSSSIRLYVLMSLQQKHAPTP